MRMRTRVQVWVFHFAVLTSLASLGRGALSEETPAPTSTSRMKARLGGDFKTYDYYDKTSLGLKASYSYTQDSCFAVRAALYGLSRFGETAGQAALGGSYWVTPNWVLEFDGDISTHSNILPLFSGALATSVTIAAVATPGVSFEAGQYSDATSFNFVPSFSWSIVPQIEVGAKLNAGLTFFVSGKSSGTIAGAAKITASPYDFFSIHVGTTIGEEPFDPGDPRLPLSSFFAQHVVGGVKFAINKYLGAEVNLDREWRSNGQNIFGGNFGAFYNW